MTRLGNLRRRLTLQRPVLTDDGSGGQTTTWETVAEVWGEVRAPARAERLVAGRLDGIVTHDVRLRHRDDAAGGWRLLDGARSLRVLAAADPDGRRRWLDLRVEEEGR